MIGESYKRYLCSSRTAVLLVAVLVITGVSYYLTYLDKMELLYQLSTEAEDLNLEAMRDFVESYNGFRFFFSFYNMADEFYAYVLVLFAWIGIFVTSEFFTQREDGYGNCIVSRCGYRRYSGQLLAAQTLYLATVLGLVMLLQLAGAFAVGGADTLYYQISSEPLGVAGCLGLIVLVYTVMLFYCVCINTIGAACACWIQNRYFMQVFPILAFAIVPMLIGSTLANVLNFPYLIVDITVPFTYLTLVFRMFNVFYEMDLYALLLSMGMFCVAAWTLWRISVRKLEGNYL